MILLCLLITLTLIVVSWLISECFHIIKKFMMLASNKRNVQPEKMMPLTEKLLPKFGELKVKFTPREQTKKRAAQHIERSFRFPESSVPTVTLPVDNTGSQKVSAPIDGNDTYGDCGEAMAAHGDNIFTYGCGATGYTESVFDSTSLVNQYLKVSGGDNGLDEDMVVNQIWTSPGVANNPAATIVDSLDIDVTNQALTQFALANNFLVCMAWSVPERFLLNFATGEVFSGAYIPDPLNGHFVPLADIGGPNSKAADGTNLNGFYSLWTWGTYCWVDQAFVNSVQPQCFSVFSVRSFNSQGYDCKGRHITAQAALWVQCGGTAIPASILNAFPPPTINPTPTPTPLPTPNPVNTITTYSLNGITLTVPVGVTVSTLPFPNQIAMVPSPTTVLITSDWVLSLPSPTPTPTPSVTPNILSIIEALIAEAPEIEAVIQAIITAINSGKPVVLPPMSAQGLNLLAILAALMSAAPQIMTIIQAIITAADKK